MSSEQVHVLALVPDLLDRSRVAAAAPGTRFCSGAGELVAEAAAATGQLVVLVDLGRPGALDAAGALVEAGRRVVGFGSHLDTELLERGRATGAEVLPRSRLFRTLPEVLAGSPL